MIYIAPIWQAGTQENELDFRQLRYFVAVAEERSFSKAALKVHIAQPALSRQIQMLEDELGAELFSRSAKGVDLTASGARLLDKSRSILFAVSELKSYVQAVRDQPAGDVSIGVSPSLVPVLGARLLAICATRYPLVNVHLVEGLGMFLTPWLVQSRLDLAVFTPVGQPPGVELHEVATDEIVVVGSPKLLEQWQQTIPARAVASLPLLITPGFAFLMRGHLQEEGIPDYPHREIDSVVTVKDIVLQGSYCSILGYSFVHEEVTKGLLRALRFEDRPMVRHIAVALKQHRTQSLAAQKVEEVVRECLQQLPVLKEAA